MSRRLSILVVSLLKLLRLRQDKCQMGLLEVLNLPSRLVLAKRHGWRADTSLSPAARAVWAIPYQFTPRRMETHLLLMPYPQTDRTKGPVPKVVVVVVIFIAS